MRAHFPLFSQLFSWLSLAEIQYSQGPVPGEPVTRARARTKIPVVSGRRLSSADAAPRAHTPAHYVCAYTPGLNGQTFVKTREPLSGTRAPKFNNEDGGAVFSPRVLAASAALFLFRPFASARLRHARIMRRMRARFPPRRGLGIFPGRLFGPGRVFLGANARFLRGAAAARVRAPGLFRAAPRPRWVIGIESGGGDRSFNCEPAR